ncbi:hypothetical protein OEA41_006604 [Lepraria neglecta]|uniref:Prokaryotic-type class I peptide chain release factors domain-containing protein n=1 Tax=Lepraria neglecta TaxID=209136 RepID=A0AAE0DL39_9LECA|nr:hypothetical protein OEA41_006604 [Lepraria neglecta]
MFITRWGGSRRCIYASRRKAVQAWRYQSTTTAATPTISPALLGRARALAAEHAQLSKKLNCEYDKQLAKQAGALSAVAEALNGWEAANNSLPELQQLIKDPSTDAELRSLAAEELATTSEELSTLSKELQASLIPQHPFADMPCLVEIRPGAGGNEAALFAGDLLRMYRAFCKRKGLRANLLKLDSSASVSSDDQIEEAVLEIDAAGAYDIFRCEAGVHRVQRVPATENKGRTHTSAVSVLVLPNFPEQGEEEMGAANFDDPSSDYYIDPGDVRTDVMRARGAGGQHVNTTDSAVRLTHIPTNTVIAIQDSRSQPKNRAKAWQILRAKLAQQRRDAREEEMAQLRVSVIGVARMGRGDKIRTYNWSQQRVTDHRSGITLHHLDDILEGGESLDQVMSSVKEWLKTRDVESLIADEEAERAKSEGVARKTHQ